MEFKHYWWIIIILLLLGIILNGIRDLKRTSFKRYLDKKNARSTDATDKNKPTR